MATKMRRTAGGKAFELIIQDEYLIVMHQELPQLLLLPRLANNASSALDVSVENVADFQHLHGRRMGFDAIYGVFTLLRGPYLAVVTQSKSAAKGVDNKDIRLVQKLELMLIPTQHLPVLTPAQEEDEDKYLAMLTSDIEAQKLHFARDYDLTHSLQRISAFNAKSPRIAERADRRFCWNYPVCAPFIGESVIASISEEKKLFDWITPMMQAYVEVTEDIKVNDAVFKILYISRRSCKRQGTRFTMRGIDDEGNVANFVETEQICLFADGKQTSFVQIRGSIPVFWSSPVTMKYAPKVYQRGQPEKDIAAFKLHAYEMMSLYGRVLTVNLIDKKKEQLKLGEAMAKTIADAATQDSHILANVRYVWFDFHHECSKMKWFNLEKLIKQVDDDFQDYGYFCTNADGQVVSTQSGVVRTNCMDNLDRTNVVQSLFGRRSLLLQLNETAALKGNVLNSPFESLEPVFKGVWGNNADAISFFYAGTGALKTDFTRTGKRTKRGALMDGYNSCIRYIMNNFMDGYRQDVIDLLLGKFTVSRSKSSPFRQRDGDSETLESVLAKLMGVVMAFFLLESFRSGGQTFVVERLLKAVFWTFLICLGVFGLLLKKGNALGQKLVQLPQLRPQDGCVTTWKN
ncbi:Phosphatidylinositide phosphatase sac1-like protein, partial [Globisporangium splendens]